MTRILHIADLHFGAERPEVIEALHLAATTLRPDLVVISGDLTQRGSEREFRAAADFIDRLEPPVLAVPGNHDLPQRDPLARFTRPLAAYRRHIAPRTADRFASPHLAICGLNSARPFGLHWNWAHGRVSPRDLAGAAEWLRQHADRAFRAVVVHHPPVLFEPRRGFRRLGRADALLETLHAARAQAVLSGHLHATGWRLIDGVVHLQAGTTTSSRTRAEANAMLVLDVEPGQLRVTHRSVADDGRFAEHASEVLPLRTPGAAG